MSEKDLELATPGPRGEISATLQEFEQALLAHADALHLPSDGVLVAVPQRVQVLANLDGAMANLPREKRATAMYLSKFIMAVSAGLFDAALNYLWDETIGELRKRIIAYDLDYFFDNAVSSPEKRKDLSGPDDMLKVTDDELIRAAAKIGFVSSVGQQQLDLVRFMRNHASAAHPNQHELQPFTLLGYMETCIKEVITLPDSPTMVATSRLLANIKRETVTPERAESFAPLFEGLRRDQTETLANGLFGLYVAPESTSVIRDNIRLLLPLLWPHVAESVKANFGVRYARFQANLDVAQAELAHEFLVAVGGTSYLPEDIRSGQIDALLDRLRSAHHGFDNFYNEPPVAHELETYIGTLALPAGVNDKFAQVIVDAFLGRSAGLAYAADPIYERLLRRMTPKEAARALLVATGPDVSALLRYDIPKAQLDRLLDIIEPKLISRSSTALMQHVRRFTGPPSQMAMDTKMQALRAKLAEKL